MSIRPSSRGCKKSDRPPEPAGRRTTMDRKVNWGILGCAGVAEKAFIPAVRGSRNGVLAGIAARDENRARDWAGRFGFLKSHRTYQELIEDPAIHAIYNPLPNYLHTECPSGPCEPGNQSS